MQPVEYHGGRVRLYPGDCLATLKGLPSDSVDAVVTDPPYHLTSIVQRFGGAKAAPAQHGTDGAFARASKGFMQREWDGGDVAFRKETWELVLRVLRPGGYIVAFSAARTFHHMATALESAGFITHPLIGELFDSQTGVAEFLASLSDVQLDAFLRILDRQDPVAGLLGWVFASGMPKATHVKAPGYEGFRYGAQAVKPALEPIYMGQKPFSEKTGTANVLKHGTGALNIAAALIEYASEADRAESRDKNQHGDFGSGARENRIYGADTNERTNYEAKGRWPANVVHSGDASVEAAFAAFGESKSSDRPRHNTAAAHNLTTSMGRSSGDWVSHGHSDAGSPSRFFFSGKADADDRLITKHPTVKPIPLLQWLSRLCCPPGGTILDPFAGSGTLGEAALREGFNAVLCEKEDDYVRDIGARMELVFRSRNARRLESAKAKGQGVEFVELPLFGGGM